VTVKPASSLTEVESTVLQPSHTLARGMSMRRQRFLFHVALLASDSVALSLAFFTAYTLRFHSNWELFATTAAS